ncbi:MAG: Xaa-Pro aminopeptidase [Gammaproteobacteria bacterium]|nr:Xaa-Pro aminopeptidase [Gammaproteobacteria bacterium]
MKKQEFKQRREQLMRQMGAKCIAILPNAPSRQRNRDIDYPYRPDSDFYYLTGFGEPESVAVLVPQREHGEFLLFCRESDPKKEAWDGAMAGLEGAKADYGADDAFPITDIDEILPGLLENRDRVYYAMGCNEDFDQRVMGWIKLLRKQSRSGVHPPGEFVALDQMLHDMRLFKSAVEVKTMRRAAEISAAAHRRAMACCRPGMYEYQLEAELLYSFQAQGARSVAYPSIVGGGRNGCILHYIDNDKRLKRSDLVLIDAAAEYDYYAADITRTFPVSGRFSRAQREIYLLVLAAQQAAIAAVQPGNHWNQPHEAAVEVLTAGLIELGILKGRLNRLIENESYKKFYLHRTGHWLGMDVHDVGDYKVGDEWRVFEPGMTLTVEPGLYIPANSKRVAKKWWNIGIRIEDNLLVTRNGHEILSHGVPKDPDEIEALMAAETAESSL